MEYFRKSRVFCSLAIAMTMMSGCLDEGTNDQSAGDLSKLVTWLRPTQLVSAPSANGSQLNIAWRPTAPDLRALIYRSMSEKGDFSLIGENDSSSFVFTDSNVVLGKQYFYRVALSKPRAPLAELNVSPGDESSVSVQTSRCLVSDFLRSVRSEKSIASVRKKTQELYQLCRSRVISRLPFDLNESEVKAVFAAFLAHNMATAGSSDEITLMDLLTAPTFHCGNYAVLTGHFYELLVENNYNEEIFFAGFSNDVIGVHAQVFFKSPDRWLLLDPTIGLVAIASLEELIAGRGVPSNFISTFYSYWNDPLQAVDLNLYYWRVRDAVRKSLYHQQDILYFFPRKSGLEPTEPYWSHETSDQFTNRISTSSSRVSKSTLPYELN